MKNHRLRTVTAVLNVALLGAAIGAGAALAQVEAAHLRVDGMT